MEYALRNRIISKNPLVDGLAAVSVGIVDNEARLDLFIKKMPWQRWI